MTKVIVAFRNFANAPTKSVEMSNAGIFRIEIFCTPLVDNEMQEDAIVRQWPLIPRLMLQNISDALP
jgi:hypothetical protein